MDFGYTGPFEVTEQNFITIARFMHRHGLFEDAITKHVQAFGLEPELMPRKKCNRKNKERIALGKKITMLERFCENPPRTPTSKESERIACIKKALGLYKKENGVRDLRNAIAHEPILVSVMGAWQPGPGYVKTHGPIYVRPQTGEEIEMLATWSFEEIDALSQELLLMLEYLGYVPKEEI